MVKADASSLKGLNEQLTKQLDQYSLRFEEVYRIHNVLSQNWDEEKFGSFSSALDKITKAKLDVESGIIEIRKLIAQMLELAERYDRIRF